VDIEQQHNELNTSTLRSDFKVWFKSRYPKPEDEQRLISFREHLDKLSALLDLDIYSIGIDNLLKQYQLSKDIYQEHLAPQGKSILSPKNHSLHLYSLSNLLNYKRYKNRPELFQRYSDLLNSDIKNLTVGSALTYTSEAQRMAEKFSKITFNKELKAAIQDEPDFFELLEKHIGNNMNQISFKGITHFEAYLKRIK
jgi:predicted NAD/FAD-binding protein